MISNLFPTYPPLHSAFSARMISGLSPSTHWMIWKTWSAWFRACLLVDSRYTLDGLLAWFQASLSLVSHLYPSTFWMLLSHESLLRDFRQWLDDPTRAKSYAENGELKTPSLRKRRPQQRINWSAKCLSLRRGRGWLNMLKVTPSSGWRACEKREVGPMTFALRFEPPISATLHRRIGLQPSLGTSVCPQVLRQLRACEEQVHIPVFYNWVGHYELVCEVWLQDSVF